MVDLVEEMTVHQSQYLGLDLVVEGVVDSAKEMTNQLLVVLDGVVGYFVSI